MHMLSTQIEILLIIVCGYILGKRGVMSPKARAEITNIVIYVVLPCNIFASFGKDTTAAMMKSGAVILAVGFGMQVLYGIFNLFLWRNRLFSKEQVSVAKYATYCNNSGFMGLPVIESFYGEVGMFYGAINLIPIRIVMWTAGLSQFTATSWRSKVRVLATHPCIWAVILGIGYIFAPFELPAFANNAIHTTGACTTFLSMLVVGSILSECEVKTAFDVRTLYYSLFRLIIIPLVIFGLLCLIGVDPTARGVAVLSAAMPAATTTAMLADKYGADAKFAARLIFVSTAFSLATLPLVSLIL